MSSCTQFSIACNKLYLTCIYDNIIHFHLLYSWKASCIYEMQFCPTRMNLLYIVTHCVYGFNKLFHDIWQF